MLIRFCIKLICFLSITKFAFAEIININNDQIKETIVVGIWSIYRDRNANYFPKKIFESL